VAALTPSSRKFLTAAAATVAILLTLSYAGAARKNSGLRGEIDALKSQYSQTRVSLEKFIRDEEEHARSREIAARNSRNLRKSFLESTHRSREWEGERNEIVQTASQISMERERAEASAAKAREETDVLSRNTDKLRTDLEAERRAKDSAREEGRREALLRSRNTTRVLVEQVKKFEAKEADYQKAIDAFDELQRDHRRAVDQLRAANRLAEESSREIAVAHYNLGVYHARNAQYAPAAEEFERSIARDPNDPMAHYNLALVYDTYLERPDAAMKEYALYLKLLPEAGDSRAVEHRLHQLTLQKEVGLERNLEKNKY
jgi:tetratricopeptide (TPR) repeat protein